MNSQQDILPLMEKEKVPTKRTVRRSIQEPCVQVPIRLAVQLFQLFKLHAKPEDRQWVEDFLLIQKLEARAFGIYKENGK